MSGVFKVGEIVVGQNHVYDTEYNGMEGQIVEGLETRRWVTERGEHGKGFVYVVEWATGERCATEPKNIRRKPPHKREIDTVVSWDICAWRPVGVPA